MKHILLSIRPQWIAKILNGEKTLEIRKSCPKCELPCEVYIYCTKGGEQLVDCPQWVENELYHQLRYDEDIALLRNSQALLNGKVVAKFTLNKVEAICCEGLENGCGGHNYFYSLEDGEDIRKKACLDEFDLRNYLGTKLDGDEVGYAWHIDNLVIFDKPKELEEFEYPNPSGIRNIGQRTIKGLPSKKHPPQSWCYVEVDE